MILHIKSKSHLCVNQHYIYHAKSTFGSHLIRGRKKQNGNVVVIQTCCIFHQRQTVTADWKLV